MLMIKGNVSEAWWGLCGIFPPNSFASMESTLLLFLQTSTLCQEHLGPK